MSEHGWRGFLAVEGVEDWAVLHGGERRLRGTSPSSASSAPVLRLPMGLNQHGRRSSQDSVTRHPAGTAPKV